MELKITTGTTIFMDTAPFIYFFEKHPDYFPVVSGILDDVYSSGAQLTTSVITYIEIATLPARLGNNKLVAKYRDFFTNSENVSLRSISVAAMDEIVRFRAKYKIRTPDAIQLALAERCGADIVITNDAEWKKVKELNVVLLKDLIGE